MARTLINWYADPTYHPNGLTVPLHGLGGTAISNIATTTFEARVATKRLRQGLTSSGHIEQISHDIGTDTWTMTFGISRVVSTSTY